MMYVEITDIRGGKIFGRASERRALVLALGQSALADVEFLPGDTNENPWQVDLPSEAMNNGASTLSICAQDTMTPLAHVPILIGTGPVDDQEARLTTLEAEVMYLKAALRRVLSK